MTVLLAGSQAPRGHPDPRYREGRDGL